MKILILCVIFYFTGVCNAQTTECNLTLKDAPVLRGFKLGMLVSEANKSESIKEKIASSDFGSDGKAGFPDVNYYLKFNKNKLEQVRASYKTSDFSNLGEFVAALNKSLNLPNAWEKGRTSRIEDLPSYGVLIQKRAEKTAEYENLKKQYSEKMPEVIKVKTEIDKINGEVEDLKKSLSVSSEYYLVCKGFALNAYFETSIDKRTPILLLSLIVESGFKPE